MSLHRCWRSGVVAVWVGVCAGGGSVPIAHALIIQPDEAASKDTFTYQFLPAFNFETSGPSFQSVLAAATTNSGHNVHALLQFDLSAAPWSGAQLAEATLNLYALDGGTVGFPFANPTEASPIFLEVRPLVSSWSEVTVNWSSEPAAGALAGGAPQAGVNQWVSIDITDLARAWLDGTVSNQGVVITLLDVVNVDGLEAAGVFASASASDASKRPYLELMATPEPGGAVALLVAAAMLRRAARQT